MKIVVTGTRGIPGIQGGVETHCQELYPLIADEQHEIIVIRRPNYAVDRSVQIYKQVAIKDISAPRSKHLEAFVHTFKAVIYARKVKADIVHIHAVGPAPVARLLGMKVVITHHGPDYDRDKWGRFAKWILCMGERAGVYYANHIIVISEHIRQIIYHQYSAKRNVTLIHNGVNVPTRVIGTEYLESLDLTEYGYVLAVGGFIKGDKLAQLYTYAKVFVLPSTHEGLPIALLEAMSYGCPVLASDIPANKEIGLPDECYFRNGDFTNLLHTLKEKIEISQSKRITYDLSSYSWHHIAQQTKEIYDSLIV